MLERIQLDGSQMRCCWSVEKLALQPPCRNSGITINRIDGPCAPSAN